MPWSEVALRCSRNHAASVSSASAKATERVGAEPPPSQAIPPATDARMSDAHS